MGNTAKTPKRKVVQEVPIKKTISVSIILTFILKLITFPFYVIYLFLFKIPTDGPAYVVGFLRFCLFVTLSVFMTKNNDFEHFLKHFIEQNSWIPISAEFILAITALVMLLNLFLSFMEVWGFSTGSYWYSPHEDTSNGATYDAIEEGFDYRDALLKATCRSANSKIKEFKKTSFMTKDRVQNLGDSSPEMNEALELLNSQMRANGTTGKLRILEETFGKK